ncbi:hypothetical protein LBMAG41_04740 [Cyanobium sp.]|nr:hypothetical protein LBMAG41_04740 [Cyanobium sp.]
MPNVLQHVQALDKIKSIELLLVGWLIGLNIMNAALDPAQIGNDQALSAAMI